MDGAMLLPTMSASDWVANTTETFSSDGPRKIFYNAAGAPITPGNLLFATGGGTTLQKPDLTAADGVVTHTPGFNPFFGTSAAAPHGAAIAALVRSARPDYTVAQTKAAMTSSALDDFAIEVCNQNRRPIYGRPEAVFARRRKNRIGILDGPQLSIDFSRSSPSTTASAPE